METSYVPTFHFSNPKSKEPLKRTDTCKFVEKGEKKRVMPRYSVTNKRSGKKGGEELTFSLAKTLLVYRGIPILSKYLYVECCLTMYHCIYSYAQL